MPEPSPLGPGDRGVLSGFREREAAVEQLRLDRRPCRAGRIVGERLVDGRVSPLERNLVQRADRGSRNRERIREETRALAKRRSEAVGSDRGEDRLG